MDVWIEDVTRMGLAVAPGMTLEWASDIARTRGETSVSPQSDLF